MKRFVLLFVCQLLISGCWLLPAPALPFQRSSIIENYFIQILDHSKMQHQRIFFPQRYFMSRQFQKPDGPIFLKISGESWDKYPMAGSWIEELAPYFGALCFEIEHRYYGFSSPPEWFDPNLQYLDSKQAVSDVIEFVDRMNSHMNLTEKKWVVFGGSYAGSLAAWVKLKRPDLIFAAVAHSAPLEATVDQRLPIDCPPGYFYSQLDVWSERSWIHQVCNEFGWITYGHCNNHITTFVNEEINFYSFCTQYFNRNFNLEAAERGIAYTNIFFGGKTYNVSHTMFIHGSLDYWRYFGIVKSSNPLMPVWTVPGARHCYSDYSDSRLQSMLVNRTIDALTVGYVQESKKQIMGYLTQWLQGESYSMYGDRNL